MWSQGDRSNAIAYYESLHAPVAGGSCCCKLPPFRALVQSFIKQEVDMVQHQDEALSQRTVEIYH